MSKKPKGWRPRLVKTLIAFFALALVAGIATAVCYRTIHTDMPEKSLVYYEYTEELPAASYALIPGGAIKSGNLGLMAINRLKRGVTLYEKKLVRFLVVSGTDSETGAMTTYLLLAGIPAKAIKIDRYGLDTYQSLARAKAAYPEQSFYFCTQEYYAPRTAYLIEALNMDGHCINADLLVSEPDLQGRIREYLAATKAVWEGTVIHAEVKYDIKTYPFMKAKEIE